MFCPQCNNKTGVKGTKSSSHNTIRRRRFCKHGHRFTTFESLLNPAMPKALTLNNLTTSSATYSFYNLSL